VAVTIRDVAVKAEVSVATVSRALRSHPSISERTREHVVAVAHEMGYVLPVRNAPARLENTRPRVALIVPFVGRWYFARVLEGAERVMHDRGIDVAPWLSTCRILASMARSPSPCRWAMTSWMR
jgi:LacI family repressor for deo operon, udp, cdd, tsx, nupC, and nupG